MSGVTFSQSAYGELPYIVDWADWLASDGATDTITAHEIVATSPLVVVNDSHTTTTVVVWLNSEACSVGDLLPFRVHIETADGLKESLTLRMAIVE